MRILEKIEQAQRGEIQVEEIPGSTTERLAIGLVFDALEKTNPSFGDDKRGAWERLDRSQRRIVRDLNPEHRKKKWLTAEDIAMAQMADPAWLERVIGVRELRIRRGDGQ